MKVLIVDDNAADRKVLRYYLEARSASVREAENGEAGLAAAERELPDLIISDALMPDMDGFQFLRRVSASPALRGTPFIFYSAVYTGAEDRELALSLGAEAFIVKPKDPEEFWAEVKAALEQTATHWRRKREQVREEETTFLQKYSAILAKKVEQKVGELTLSEERFRDMVEKSPDWFWEFDRDANFTYVSPQVESLLGYKPEEILGRNAFDLMKPEEAARVHLHFDPVARKYFPFAGLANVNLHKDGREVVIESSGTPIFSKDGEFCGYRGIDRDITDRQRAAEELRQALNAAEAARRQIDALLKSVTDGIIITDGEDRVLMINARGEDLLGTTLDSARGRPVREAVSAPAFLEDLDSLLARQEQEVSLDLQLTDRRLGAERTIQAQAFAATDPKGRHLGTICILHDVTREREIDRMKNDFISTAAHELRTPLTSVLGFTEYLLQHRDLPETEREEYLGIIIEKGEILAKIIDTLLDLSRIEAGRPIQLEKSPSAVGELLSRWVDQYRKEHHRRRFEALLPEPPDMLEVDRFRLRQVMDNLISNAIKYSRDEGIIRVTGTFDSDSDSYRVSVADEGIGMTPEQVKKVFDKFYRADASNTALSGLGLGMAIARGIVEAHGGRIWLESMPGKGTTVTFAIPAGKDRCNN